MRLSPNGDLLATAADDRQVRVVDFKTGKVLHSDFTFDLCILFNLALIHFIGSSLVGISSVCFI